MKLTAIGKNGKPLAKGSRAKPLAFVDKWNGLMWASADVSADSLNFNAAVEAASKCKTAGFKDWRLPTIDELETLRDRSRFNPAADPQLGLKSTWYWSSSPNASAAAGCAWIVGFYSGYSGCYPRDHGALVRAVRSASPASNP